MTARLFLIVAALGSWAAIASAEETVPTDPKDGRAAEENTSKPGEIGSSFQRPRIALRGLSLLFDQLPSTNLEISPEGGIAIYRDQGDFTLHIGGRLLIDAARYFEDKNDLGENFGLADARLELQGIFRKDLAYRFSGGIFASSDGGKISIKDLYVRYLGLRPFFVTAGQQAEPFSLEAGTSTKRVTFMQRGLPNAFAPGDTFGLAIEGSGDRWHAKGGIFLGDGASQKDQGDQGKGITGRVTAQPIARASSSLFIGGSFSLRNTGFDDDVQFENRPEMSLTDIRYVNTGSITGATSIRRLGVEAVAIWGPYSVQAEYMGARVPRANFGDPEFHGWYVFASWFPTGESRNYSLRTGNFRPITPKHDYGAIELAARYSSIDLTSETVFGGEEKNVTFGVNWYVRPRIRLMANYVFVWADENANDNGTVLGNDSPQALMFRFQIHF